MGGREGRERRVVRRGVRRSLFRTRLGGVSAGVCGPHARAPRVMHGPREGAGRRGAGVKGRGARRWQLFPHGRSSALAALARERNRADEEIVVSANGGQEGRRPPKKKRHR